MKKILALVFALILAAGMVAALADTYTDTATITIGKQYKALNGGVSPAETFSFSALEQVSITENPAATWPAVLPTITSIAYAEGNATMDGTGTGTKTATITLPTYTAVGVYTYKFHEVTPATKTAGVSYKPESEDLFLVVSVVQDGNNNPRVAAVHCEGAHAVGTYGTAPKTDTFTNTYSSGTLTVSKTVTGNLGDRTKKFDVTVTFTAAEGEQINSTIKYSGNTGSDYTTEATVQNNTVTLHIKHGDEVTFTNIPAGVSYTVAEADYTAAGAGESKGYDAAIYANSDDSTKTSTGGGSITAGDADTVGITNNKALTIDTGITLETLPYVLVLAAAVVGAALLIARRHRQSED